MIEFERSDRVKVSCMGDVEVLDFPPEESDGCAWVLLRDGPAGVIGRDSDTNSVDLRETPGICIGMKDAASAAVLARAFERVMIQLHDAGMGEIPEWYAKVERAQP